MLSPIGKAQVFVEDTSNTRACESGINRGCKIRGEAEVQNHMAFSGVTTDRSWSHHAISQCK